MDSKRPLRDKTEGLLSKVPEGPKSFIGGGNALGVIGFGTLEFINGFSPVPIGYEIQSSSLNEGEETDIFEYSIWAASRDVARFVAKRESVGPSFNFSVDDAKAVKISKKRERRVHTLWFIRVEVDRDDVPDRPSRSESLV